MKTRAEIESEIRRLLVHYKKYSGEGITIRNFFADRILTLFYVLEYVVPIDIQETVNCFPYFPYRF